MVGQQRIERFGCFEERMNPQGQMHKHRITCHVESAPPEMRHMRDLQIIGDLAHETSRQQGLQCVARGAEIDVPNARQIQYVGLASSLGMRIVATADMDVACFIRQAHADGEGIVPTGEFRVLADLSQAVSDVGRDQS
ncbi:hypothetical protein [Mesorhizobium shangrilense]|uniref:PIN domain-containing protein n=1 Tax=Mesorhizobium shangrilense TaxID=460060 RepID=A0ABV2DL61_9HYPH